MPLVIPEDHIKWRLENFWGYGSFDAPVWFVGMEEGLSNGGEDYLPARFAATNGKALVDIRRDMINVKDHMIWFTRRIGETPYPIQQTIRFPIALYLYLSLGRPPNKFEISIFQGEQYGGEAACAIDLMPLPSNNTHDSSWLYERNASLDLGTRSRYLQKYRPIRVRMLREIMENYKPKLVIFYSVGYREYWADVAGARFRELTRQMYCASSGETRFCIIPSARTRGLTYARLYEFGNILARAQFNRIPTATPVSLVPATRPRGERTSRRLEYSGRYAFANSDQIRRRAADTGDPRHIFYRAMLVHGTYEAYEADVGATKVVTPTPFGQKTVTGHAEIVYARDRVRWIRDASN